MRTIQSIIGMVGIAGMALGQHIILEVSPDQTDPGTSGVLVTFTLPDTTPPTPPQQVSPTAAMIGTISGTSLTRVDLDTVTAVFDFPVDAQGAMDCVVTFPTPEGTLELTMSGGFTVGEVIVVPSTLITNTQPMAGSYPIVDTAQTNFYSDSSSINSPSNSEAFFGQDGTYIGRQMDYTVSGDGLTVLDNVTGLTWTQSHDWNGDDALDSSDKMTQANAAAYVATLNASSYGGYSDWRLPTIKELYSLMDFNGTDPDIAAEDSAGLTPFINSAFSIGYGDTAADERLIDSQFAVSTIYVDTVMNGQEAMFGLNLVDGRIKGYPTQTGKTYYALFCRGNTAYGINNFSDNGDGTVNDAATGLMWAQDDSLVGMDWEAALAFAETNELAGYTDWRLPNAKELQSLVDYTRSPGGTTNEAAIDPVFSATQITNMANELDYPWYWSGTTHLKYTGSAASGVYVCFGRGMGTMDSGATIIDVHGAGCQRSDPKSGDPADYPNAGNGPQGDVQRVFNHVRLVRDIELPADMDGDGMSDDDEIFAGSNPADPDSIFQMTLNGDTLSWPSREDRDYFVQYCTNIVEGHWAEIGSSIPGSPTETSVIINTNLIKAYFRMHVEELNEEG